MEKVLVDRFALGIRLTHWIHGVLIVCFLITGYGIFSGSYLFGDYAVNLSLHMIMSFAVLLDGIAHLYMMSITGDRRAMWVEMKDIKDTITIAKSWLGLTKEYPEYGTYDVQKKQFYKKYHPVVKMKYWADAYFVGFAAITGYIMYYESVANYAGSLLGFIGLPLALTWIRAIHFIVFIYFLVSLSGHIYLSLIPVNWEVLKSMITGKENVEVHQE
jgi:thiosulfate reductase cytochrome b subunit